MVTGSGFEKIGVSDLGAVDSGVSPVTVEEGWSADLLHPTSAITNTVVTKILVFMV
jgi:hypothetical protein